MDGVSTALAEQVELALVEYVVSQTADMNQAAQRLGMGVRTLQVKLRQIGYEPRTKPQPIPLKDLLARIQRECER